MKIASTIARYLLGAIFLTFGLNGFLHFIPMPPPAGVAGQFFGALFVSQLYVVIFALQIVPAVLLLVNRYVPLALTILAAIIFNILSFHIFMAPCGIAAGHLSGRTVGRGLHQRATGLFRVVPVAL